LTGQKNPFTSMWIERESHRGLQCSGTGGKTQSLWWWSSIVQKGKVVFWDWLNKEGINIGVSMYIGTSPVDPCVGENRSSLVTALKSFLPCFLQSRDGWGAFRAAASALNHHGTVAFSAGEILQSSSLQGK